MRHAILELVRIDFVFFDAGGGHRSAAIALKAVIEKQQRPWDVRLVNLQEVLDPLDVFRKYTGVRLQDLYNLMLARGYTLGSGLLLRGMHGIIRIYHRGAVRLLTKFWSERSPDLVVSLVPNFNRAMWEALQSRTPLITLLTDFADYPPHFWIEQQDQYFICGTEKAVEQARVMGHSGDRIFHTSGMIVRPNFYEPLTADRSEERIRLGLNPDLPTGLVLFGGQGSNQMVSIAARISRNGLKLQLILICGRNQILRERLNALHPGYPMHVEGFTNEIPYFMHLSDFFIGKPGPGSISEALMMKLPVIVERNAWTLPQERYNAEWIVEKQVGVVLRSLRDIAEGLGTLLDEQNFARFRANAAAINNRAVFEIPEMLEAVLLNRIQPAQPAHRE